MYKKLLLLIISFFLLGLFGITAVGNNSIGSINKSIDASISSTGQITHPSIFFDKDIFYQGVEQAKKDDGSFEKHASGGIIPHHLFPSFIIADFFSHLSAQNPETIILIGPNHYERGDYKILSSLCGWETPFGIVKPNQSIIKEIVKSNLIKIDEEVLPNEHSVAGIMPFIKYYLPQAQVVPIILSSYMTQEDTLAMAENLKRHIDKNTIIIASVDFSHYLSSKEAQEKDEVTLKIIKDFNHKRLFSLDNDYTDSPASIATILMIMQALGTTNMEILHHTNSGQLLNDNHIETTSYFSIMYYKL